jgi:hypothetical protein
MTLTKTFIFQGIQAELYNTLATHLAYDAYCRAFGIGTFVTEQEAKLESPVQNRARAYCIIASHSRHVSGLVAADGRLWQPPGLMATADTITKPGGNFELFLDCVTELQLDVWVAEIAEFINPNDALVMPPDQASEGEQDFLAIRDALSGSDTSTAQPSEKESPSLTQN